MKIESLSNPKSLIEEEDVEYVEKTREFEEEKFEALKERYEKIDGVVMVGVTNEDGEVLLQYTDENWDPPGGNVKQGEDWVEAARKNMERLTGEDITIDQPKSYELYEFKSKKDGSSFEAGTVLFEGSLIDENTEFLEDPKPIEEVASKYREHDVEIDLGWFDEVPKDAHPNHLDHIRIFLD